jgi:hypothetical protein
MHCNKKQRMSAHDKAGAFYPSTNVAAMLQNLSSREATRSMLCRLPAMLLACCQCTNTVHLVVQIIEIFNIIQ